MWPIRASILADSLGPKVTWVNSDHFWHGRWLSNIASTIQVQILLWPIRMEVLRWVKLKFSYVTPVGVKTTGSEYHANGQYKILMAFLAQRWLLCILSPSFSSAKCLLPLQLFFSPSPSPPWFMFWLVLLMWQKCQGNSPDDSCILVSDFLKLETTHRKWLWTQQPLTWILFNSSQWFLYTFK